MGFAVSRQAEVVAEFGPMVEVEVEFEPAVVAQVEVVVVPDVLAGVEC